MANETSELNESERELLYEALNSALTDDDELQFFVGLTVGRPPAHILKPGNVQHKILQFIFWCESQGLTRKLIMKALDKYPHNPRVKEDLPGILNSLTQRKSGNPKGPELPPTSPPPPDEYKQAESLVLEYLARKNFQKVSFERIRKSIDSAYTDEFLMEMIRRNRATFRRAILRDVKTGQVDKPGVAKND